VLEFAQEGESTVVFVWFVLMERPAVLLSVARSHPVLVIGLPVTLIPGSGGVLASDVDVQQASLCVVINQPVGNPKRKV
jgi:hypothetical protein